MKEAILNLLKIKSLITILLTMVFCAMLIASLFMSVTIPQEFIIIYTTVIGFYFGTQTKKDTLPKSPMTYDGRIR